MALTNLYSNLPGHLVEFKDGGLQLTTSTTDTSSTKSILILGTATDGPINEPVKIDATTVSQVFGKEVDENGYPNGATLTKYAKQAFKNGFDDVRCMRVTGSQAYATLFGQQTTAYEDASLLIDGTNGVDGAGKIHGNEEFSFFATQDTDPYFLQKEGDADSKIELNFADGSKVDANLGVTGKIEYFAYRGFTLAANAYTNLSSLKLVCKGIDFVGSTPDNDGSTLVTHEEVDASVVVTVENSGEENEVTTKTAEFSVAQDTTGVDYPIFKDTLASSFGVDGEKLPVVNASGFEISKDGVAFVDGTDYTVALDEGTGKYVVTFNDVASLQDGDTVTIKYYPYVEKEVEKEFDMSDKYQVSSLDVSAANNLNEAKLVRVTVGNISYDITEEENYASVFEVQDGVLTIKDVSAFNINDVIKAVYSYKKPVISDLELKVKSQFGGSIYKDGTVTVEKEEDEDGTVYTNIIFKRPSAKKLTSSNPPYSYSSRYYKTVDDLILAMQNDANNLNMFELEIVKGDGADSLDMLQATPETALSNGGEDGLKPTNDEMFKALSGERYTIMDIGNPISSYSTEIVTEDMIGFLKTQGAYQILENYNVDYIYPAGVYADAVQNVDPHSDFQRELALVCAVLTYRTKMTHGFIDVKPNSNTTLVGIDAYVSKLVNNHTNLYYMTDSNGDIVYDSEGNPMDIGWYTSVVVGPEVVMQSDTLGTYYGSPAIAYAGLNSVIAPQSAPTNKALRNVNGIKFKFSNKQMDALVGNRMVVFKLKDEGTASASSIPYVVDGVTSGAPNCDYARMSTVKILTDVVDQIRKVADPFIGEQNTVEQRNALSALISKRLAKLVELGEIQSYDFEISATIQQQLLGEARIALTIIPAMELRRITTVVALRAAE